MNHAVTEHLERAIRTAVFMYSEWLDGEGLVVSDGDGDDRTHEELVRDFFAQADE